VIIQEQETQEQFRYRELQHNLDELTAYFIQDTGKLPSQRTIIELLEWLKEKIDNG